METAAGRSRVAGHQIINDSPEYSASHPGSISIKRRRRRAKTLSGLSSPMGFPETRLLDYDFQIISTLAPMSAFSRTLLDL